MTTEERLEKLERELTHTKRRNRWALLAGLGLYDEEGKVIWSAPR